VYMCTEIVEMYIGYRSISGVQGYSSSTGVQGIISSTVVQEEF
jgi:hypothetical protein